MNLEVQNMEKMSLRERSIVCIFIYNLIFYAKNENELQDIRTNVKRFNNDIAMKFGSGICAKKTYSRGKLTCASHVELYTDNKVCELDQEETYKHLEIEEGNGVQDSKMKKKKKKKERMLLTNKSDIEDKTKLIQQN